MSRALEFLFARGHNMIIDLPASPVNSPISLFVLTPEHVTNDYVSWLNEPAINRYLESRFVRHTILSTRTFVSDILASPNNLLLGIKLRSRDTHVGNIKLGPIDVHHKTAELGILIGNQAAWGKGVATAAITQVSTLARSVLALRKLTAGCYLSNVGSQRAFQKAGFTIEGVRPGQFLLNNQPEDLVLMGRLLA